MIAKLGEKRLSDVFWSCLLICLIAFPPVFGDVIEVVPGQSIEGQLDLSVDEPSGYHITVTPPLNISGWQLKPDEANEQTGVLNVKANKDGWQVTVNDDNPATSGHMTEWTGSGYGTLELTNPMRVKAAYEVALPEGGLIQTGDKTKGQGQDINVAFIQEGTFADEPLSEGHVYRMVITFTGSYTM